jgi:hypothetical protein
MMTAIVRVALHSPSLYTFAFQNLLQTASKDPIMFKEVLSQLPMSMRTIVQNGFMKVTVNQGTCSSKTFSPGNISQGIELKASFGHF